MSNYPFDYFSSKLEWDEYRKCFNSLKPGDRCYVKLRCSYMNGYEELNAIDSKYAIDSKFGYEVLLEFEYEVLTVGSHKYLSLPFGELNALTGYCFPPRHAQGFKTDSDGHWYSPATKSKVICHLSNPSLLKFTRIIKKRAL